MPLILAGADVVAMAQIGSGKTTAFLISMLQKLRQHVPQTGVCALILSPTRDLAIQTLKFTKELGKLTGEEGIKPSVCYGDMDQDARKMHISRFHLLKTMLLIVTDVAARGLDIPLLDNVVNWDYPPKPKIFVHQVGMVACAGRTGTAYSFVTSEDLPTRPASIFVKTSQACTD